MPQIAIPDEKIVYAYFAQVALAVIAIIYVKVTRSDLKDYGFNVTKKLLIQGVSLSIGIGICLSLISTKDTITVKFIILSCLLAPICEEIFFRGFVQTYLMEKVRGGKIFFKFYLSYGLMLAALIFGAFHVLNIFLIDMSLADIAINTVYAIVFGLLIGYVYQETRSLLTPIIMHSCLNGFSLLPL